MSAGGQRRACAWTGGAQAGGGLGHHHEFGAVCSGSGGGWQRRCRWGFASKGRGKREARERLSQLCAPPPPAHLSQACWPLHRRSRVPSFMSCGRRGAQGISLGEGVGVGWCREGGALSRRQFDPSAPSAVRQRGGKLPAPLPPSLTPDMSDGP